MRPMRGNHLFFGAALLTIAGCGSLAGYDDLFGPAPAPPSSSAASSSTGAGGGSASSSTATASVGTGGGAGGETSATATASSSTGACVPSSNPCGGVCGQTVFDGCEQVSCTCQGTDVCGPNKTCCTPKVADDKICAGVCNAGLPDTCGGMIFCDGQCGTDTWQSCKGTMCACTDALAVPGAAVAQANCGNQKKPFYCGYAPQKDAPSSCHTTGASNQFAPGNPELWCCD